MLTDLFDYDLPQELIAQEPLPRGEARLLVLDRATGATAIARFSDLPSYLAEGDALAVNDTRVSARRLVARSERGCTAEVLLLRRRSPVEWDCLVRPGRQMRPGSGCTLDLGAAEWTPAEVTGRTEEGGRTLRFADAQAADLATRAGVAPLPPYIHSRLADEERYQTVYAAAPGSAAAPTAGLHFTDGMLAACRAAGATVAPVTLHVGVDTFRPLRTETIEAHTMHGEEYCIPEASAGIINSTIGRTLAVGTTVVRALESAATGERTVQAGAARTELFIRPGYRFKVVDALLTNFHLPKSTLLMMVCSLAGIEPVLSAYRQAVAERFRFYSFGDAMLII